ncbi:MAG TPA: PP2C family protein-serine/threonine phosphatase [Solirubrobacterales bacterium]|nr:PP2C family protein-serine/threonine phosphatase [Solirubrobacterales bacterium]
MLRGSSSVVRIVSVCAAALLVFVVWLSIENSAHTGVGFFYAIPVGLATWWFGGRAGAATALACVGLYALGARIDPVDNFGLALAIRATAFALVVVVVSVLRERLIVLEHSAEELEAIRAALTPSTLPELPGVDAGAAFVASEYGVSGDFYLLTNGPDDSTVAVVGDVVGHGPKAARLATFIRARFAAFAANTSDPAEILTLANAALVERPGRDEELVSAVCLRFQAEDSRLSYAVAGHPLPMHLPSLEELQPEGTTLLLGVSADLPLETADLTLDRSHGVLVYTDGATDVQQGETRLGSDGLSRLLGPLVRLPARVLAQEAHKAVLGWADTPLGDDLCILVLRPKA